MSNTVQQIPKGYKQTEICVIPDDWEMKQLGEKAYITKLAGYEYSNYFNSYKDAGEIIVLRGTNITHNKLDLTDIRTIPMLTSKKLPRSRLSKNDLVFAYVGTIGPVYLIEENDKYHLGPNTCKICVDETLDSRYLFAYFKSTLIEKEILDQTSVGAQPSLSMAKIRNFKVILPSDKVEQTKIANVLSNTDELIENLEKLIAKKKAIKQGVMQELLTGKKRLPGFSGEWQTIKLGKLVEMNSGGTPSTGNAGYYGGSVLWASIADMTSVGKYIYDTEKKITKKGLSNCSAIVFPVGTVLYAMYASIGECCITVKPMSTSQAILGIRCGDKINNIFLYYYLNSIKNYIKTLGQQGTQSNLNKGMVQEFEIKLPPTKEQETISNLLSEIDTEIECFETKLLKYQQIKIGMTQQLLTGKIRIYESN